MFPVALADLIWYILTLAFMGFCICLIWHLMGHYFGAVLRWVDEYFNP